MYTRIDILARIDIIGVILLHRTNHVGLCSMVECTVYSSNSKNWYAIILFRNIGSVPSKVLIYLVRGIKSGRIHLPSEWVI